MVNGPLQLVDAHQARMTRVRGRLHQLFSMGAHSHPYTVAGGVSLVFVSADGLLQLLDAHQARVTRVRGRLHQLLSMARWVTEGWIDVPQSIIAKECICENAPLESGEDTDSLNGVIDRKPPPVTLTMFSAE